MLKLAVCVFAVFSICPAWAYFEFLRAPNSSSSMNGIEFEKVRDFPKTWKLVTVRYREDTKEIRLIYANPIAADHLSKQEEGPYPDGSAFGKVAFNTEKDSFFPSSVIPSDSKRYQVMVKDEKKYAATSGWGYALFDKDGKLFVDEDVAAKTAACFACHQIVRSQDFIFARPMPFAVGSSTNRSQIELAKLNWQKVPAKQLNFHVDGVHLNLSQKVNLVSGPVADHFFSGTLDEIVPSLIEKSLSTRLPAALFHDRNSFSAVIPKGHHCYQVLIRFHGHLARNDEICK